MLPPTNTCIRLAAAFLTAVVAAIATPEPRYTLPTFTNVSVHDPSVIKAGSEYYVFGSHLASAKTPDWMHWSQISTDPSPGNPLAPNASAEFREALTWVNSNTFWAPDVIQLADGRYYMYYCVGRLDSPRAALGIAVSNSPAGPYTNLGVILRSGMWGQPSHDGRIYDPTIHPNTVDPDVFFDKTGRLWMVYGSYSGGIFIMELNPNTGFPLPGQGYGKKLIGGNHARIEGAFMLYSPESDYYYMFLSFGGLDALGGYNIRVARSRNPDGPFYDSAGTDLTEVKGAPGTLFDDASIAPHGVKLMGNYRFDLVAGEPGLVSRGYLSPGHNSAYYDPSSGRHFLVFHTRFVGRGEEHEVRVHQLVMNADEWLVAMPHRYAGENLSRIHHNDVRGRYKLINHGKAISPALNTSVEITLEPNGTITGAATGRWDLRNDYDLELTIDGTVYHGVVLTQWDDDNGVWVHAFSALSANGVTVWGSKVAISKKTPKSTELTSRTAWYGSTLRLQIPKPDGDPKQVYSYAIIDGPLGLQIDRANGVLTWNPLLFQVGQTYPVKVRVLNIGLDPVQRFFTFNITAQSSQPLQRVDLNFSSASTGGLLDRSGTSTGLTARLPGTGAMLPANDPNLTLDLATGTLNLRTTRADFNGRAGLPTNSSPGIRLSDLGFNGTQDFAITAVIRPLPTLEFIDPAGIYVGASADAVTRIGTIVWATPERYSSHSINGADRDGRFFGFGFNGADGMVLNITRQAGVWRYFIDGVEWNPLAPTTFLDGRADLVAGVFAITPLNGNAKTIEIDSISVVVHGSSQP
jgi:arabinan endo-1,5-alpha-L-arabinosidase